MRLESNSVMVAHSYMSLEVVWRAHVGSWAPSSQTLAREGQRTDDPYALRDLLRTVGALRTREAFRSFFLTGISMPAKAFAHVGHRLLLIIACSPAVQPNLSGPEALHAEAQTALDLARAPLTKS